MKSKVEEELEHLEKDGISERVQFADWAAPIVAVLKADGKSVHNIFVVTSKSPLIRPPNWIDILFQKLRICSHS